MLYVGRNTDIIANRHGKENGEAVRECIATYEMLGVGAQGVDCFSVAPKPPKLCMFRLFGPKTGQRRAALLPNSQPPAIVYLDRIIISRCLSRRGITNVDDLHHGGHSHTRAGRGDAPHTLGQHFGNKSAVRQTKSWPRMTKSTLGRTQPCCPWQTSSGRA